MVARWPAGRRHWLPARRDRQPRPQQVLGSPLGGHGACGAADLLRGHPECRSRRRPGRTGFALPDTRSDALPLRCRTERMSAQEIPASCRRRRLHTRRGRRAAPVRCCRASSRLHEELVRGPCWAVCWSAPTHGDQHHRGTPGPKVTIRCDCPASTLLQPTVVTTASSTSLTTTSPPAATSSGAAEASSPSTSPVSLASFRRTSSMSRAWTASIN